MMTEKEIFFADYKKPDINSKTENENASHV